jgi:mono/diheme cytochrome c family protein
MNSGSFWSGILGGLVLAVLIGFGVLPFLGLFETSATGEPGILDWWGNTNLHSALKRQAPNSKIPQGADLAEGFEHYRNMCLHCHGAPDAEREEWAKNMLPKPPELWKKELQEEMTEGELFYIINHGIRMTGMPAFGPAHGEQGVWNMVAFIRQLDQMSAERKLQLQQKAEQFGHSGGEGGNGHLKSGETGHSATEPAGHAQGE